MNNTGNPATTMSENVSQASSFYFLDDLTVNSENFCDSLGDRQPCALTKSSFVSYGRHHSTDSDLASKVMATYNHVCKRRKTLRENV